MGTTQVGTTVAGAKPVVIGIYGLPGCGKSFLCRLWLLLLSIGGTAFPLDPTRSEIVLTISISRSASVEPELRTTIFRIL